MKAVRIHEYGKPLRIDEVPVPRVRGGDVLVKIAGAGACHSDLHVVSGELQIPTPMPRTMGHENAGYIEEVGPDVPAFRSGDPVIVFGGWGCGHCRVCVQGEQQVCDLLRWGGIGPDGGYAEYFYVPTYRHLIRLKELDPVESAPLTDAALTPYRAIKKTLPYLHPGSSAVIIGAGGLGHFAIQIMNAVSPGTRVIAVDVADDKLQQAAELGAADVVDARGDAAAAIKKLTGGSGAEAVIDLVGNDASLKLAAKAAARKGIIVIVGLAGGALPYSFLGGVRQEVVVTSSVWGSYTELEEVIALVSSGQVRGNIERFPLADVNDVLELLKDGKIRGRAVLTP